MRILVLAVLMMCSGGCALPLSSGLVPVAPAAADPTLGMTRAHVAALMTRVLTVGYEIDPVSGAPRAIEAKSLYATEVLTIGDDVYLIDSYILGAPRPGQPVTASSLMPMIFKNDILYGKGREALLELQAGRVREE